MEKSKLWRLSALLFLCCIPTQIFAMSGVDTLSMSLAECLTYAKQNSITLQNAKLQIDNSQADQLSAKGAFLPSLSATIGQTFNTNPTNTDVDASKSTYNGTYGLDLSMTLYNGGKNRALLQQSDIANEIATLQYQEYENTIEVSITEVYVEILYAMEQIKVSEQSLEVSKTNQERGRAFYEAGSISISDLAQLESATASYEYDLVVAQSQLSNLYVSLKHLLEISQDMVVTVQEMDVADDNLLSSIVAVQDVYSDALVSRPEILSKELSIASAELDEKIAKAGYLPTLSLSAGTGLSHNSYDGFEFSDQLRNSFNTSVGVNLSVPIFSKWQNKTAVQKSQNYLEMATIEQTQAHKDLYQTIETLYNNAQTSQSKYIVSQYALSAIEKSLKLITEQYELGLKNTIELLTEQDNYNQTSQDYLTNKYQLILNLALLNYYQTDIIKL
ncbi:MAG: TolC family protein [Rikenellaceae bacterium]